jgi:hypothetical protein
VHGTSFGDPVVGVGPCAYPPRIGCVAFIDAVHNPRTVEPISGGHRDPPLHPASIPRSQALPVPRSARDAGRLRLPKIPARRPALPKRGSVPASLQGEEGGIPGQLPSSNALTAHANAKPL